MYLVTDESPLFVCQVHDLKEVPHSTGIFAPLCGSRIFGLKKIKKIWGGRILI
jgi:hypothetical protein